MDRKPRRRQNRIVLFAKEHTATAVLIVLFALFVAAVVTVFPTNDDAADTARTKGGLTSVSSVHRRWFFSLCHKDHIGYTVTGTRDGHAATVTVCAAWPSFRSYVR